MNDDDKRLFIESIAEMRELKGAMSEFKEHVIGRVKRLEQKEAERSKEHIAIISILISGAALAVAIIANFFRGGR